MTETLQPGVLIRYEGPGAGTEIWGMTQANFTVGLPNEHMKELAVLLNDPAAEYLCKELGLEDTPENRDRIARDAGDYILRKHVDAGDRLYSTMPISMATLAADPSILDYLKSTRA